MFGVGEGAIEGVQLFRIDCLGRFRIVEGGRRLATVSANRECSLFLSHRPAIYSVCVTLCDCVCLRYDDMMI